MRGKLKLFASVFALAAGANLPIAATDANAQGTDDPKTTARSDEVTVTARRIVENVQDVPIAVSVVSEKRLKELAINTIVDVVKLAPGLQTGHTTGAKRTVDPSVRGQGRSTIGELAPSVPIYFAEVAGMPATFFDVTSLQVLKGPQGTLFGSTATGGALLITPRKPTADFDASLRAELGNYNYQSVEAAMGGALIGDSLTYRVAGKFRNRDGYSKAYPSFAGVRQLAEPKDFDNIDSKEWRASLVWKPLDNLENYFIYAGNQFRSNGTAQIQGYANTNFLNATARNFVVDSTAASIANFTAATGRAPPAGQTWGQLLQAAQAKQIAVGPRTVFYDYDRTNEQNFHSIVNQTRWDITDNLTLKNIYGLYWTRTKGALLDTDASDLPLIDSTAIKNASGGSAWTGGWPDRNWSNEVQALGTLFDDKLKWQAGYYYEKKASRDFVGPSGTILVAAGAPNGLTYQSLLGSAATCAGFGVPTPCTTVNRSEYWSDGIYAQGTLAVLDNLNFTLGGRHSRDARVQEASAGFANFGSVNGVQIPLSVLTGQIPGARITKTIIPETENDTYTVSLDWKVNDNNLLYIRRGTGYKPGGINGNTPVDSPQRVYGPEDYSDYEIGWKSDWTLGGVTGRTNIAVYKGEYEGIQRSSLIPGTATTVTSNLADGVIEGVEFEQNLYFNDMLDITGFVGYTDASYKDWTETSTCASQFYRPQCVGAPTTTLVTVDHVRGILDVGGAQSRFQPDPFTVTSEWRWVLSPTVHLDDWFKGEDVSVNLTANYRSEFTASADATSLLAGGNAVPTNTVFGVRTDPLIHEGFTLVDLRADWRNIKGSKISAGVAVYNLTDETKVVGNSGGLPIAGAIPYILTEPQMWTFELSLRY